jgi:LAS superfamily LD-carboxypeptidase LdcB
MNRHQGFSLSTFVFRMILVILACSGVLLGMLMYSKYNPTRWKFELSKANVDILDLVDKKPLNSGGSEKSLEQTARSAPSGVSRAPKAPWAPTDNVPYHLRYQDNSTDLVQISQFYDVKVFLNRQAANAFKQMQSSAERDGIYLQAVSGHRSYKDQDDLFNKQIAKRGSRLEASRLSAPAGYSEHHTGYALDIGDMRNPDEVLTLSFEQSAAFRWLQHNASAYGFELSFPKNNRMNVSYEPWHWRFVGSDAAKETFRSASTMSPADQSAMESIPHQRE